MSHPTTCHTALRSCPQGASTHVSTRPCATPLLNISLAPKGRPQSTRPRATPLLKISLAPQGALHTRMSAPDLRTSHLGPRHEDFACSTRGRPHMSAPDHVPHLRSRKISLAPQGAYTCQHPTTCHTALEEPLSPQGASTLSDPTTCHTALEDFSCSSRGVHTCDKRFSVWP